MYEVMKQLAQVKDINGQVVGLGDKVKYLCAEGAWFERLPVTEKSRILEMVGKVYVINEVDEYGAPWIEAEWEYAPGYIEIHRISLASHEMVVVAGHDQLSE